jgi:hypothetical protein
MYLMARSKINRTMKMLPQNTIRDIIKQLGSPPWLTQCKLYYEVNKYLSRNNNESPQQSPANNIMNDMDDNNIPQSILIPNYDHSICSSLSASTTRKRGGHPTLETDEQHGSCKMKLLEATDIASMEYYLTRTKHDKTIYVNEFHRIQFQMQSRRQLLRLSCL